MKRPTQELRIRLLRLARYRINERLKRKARLYSPKKNRYVPPGELIKAPTRFNLTLGAGADVVKFLRAVAHTVLKMHKQVRLDFKRTDSFQVPGAILLFAEINRIVALSDLTKPITIIDPMYRRPREVLKQIEIHRLTGDSCDVVPTRDDVVFWKATRGATQSGEDLGPILEFVAERANKRHTRQVELSGIWRGVSEAVANVVDHAYSKPREDGFNGLDETKWWMFTQIRDQRFTAAVCDLGCGYRATINQNIPERFRTRIAEIFAGHNRDSLAIQTAMEYGRSGTREGNRGKGSRDALSVLESHGNGQLYILSNTGWIQYHLNGGKQEKVEWGEIGIDIKGTIIWWNLPLRDDDDGDDHN
jgi:hypothetical protein